MDLSAASGAAADTAGDNNKLEILLAKHRDLESKYDRVAREKDDLQRKYEGLLADKTSLPNEYGDLQEENAELERKYDVAVTQNTELQRLVGADAEDRAHQLGAGEWEVESAIANYELKRELHAAENAGLKVQVERKGEQITGLKSSVARLRKRNRDLENANSELSSSLQGKINAPWLKVRLEPLIINKKKKKLKGSA